MKFCTNVFGITVTVTALKVFLMACSLLVGAILGVFLGPFRSMFLYFLGNFFKYFLMKFCTDVFGISLTVTTCWGVSGLFWSVFHKY